MKTKSTLMLFVILVGLCGGYFLMLHIETRHKQRAAASRKVFSFVPDDIVSAQVQRVDESPVVGQRAKGGVWAITKPSANIEPNQVVWDRLAKAVATLENYRTIDSAPAAGGAKDLAQYGLDKPVLTIAAGKADGASVNLTFGAVEPTQKFRYATATGGNLDGAVFLVDSKSFNELDRPLSLLRYPYVINVGEEGIRRLEFAWFWHAPKPGDFAKSQEAAAKHQPGEESATVTVERSGKEPWRMIAPIRAAANQDLVEALIKEVQFAVGRNYVDDPKSLADYGLDPPKARITIYSGNKSPQTLLLGAAESVGGKGKGGGIFAKRKELPSVFVMDADILAMLPQSPDAFREGRLFSGVATDITSMHYLAGTTDILFRDNAEKGWQIVQPKVDDADQVAISGFIALLKVVKGDGFPGAAQPQFGLDNPAVTVTLNFKNGGQPSTIRLGAKVPDVDRYYAMQDNGVVTLIGQLEANGLTKTIYDFRQMSSLGFNKKEASKVAIEIEGKRYEFERPRGEWLVRAPENTHFSSQKDMDDILKLLSEMRAAAVESDAAPADPAVYGLDAPLATITVTAVKGENTEAQMILGPLKIGKPAPDNSQQRFATSPKFPGVYRIKQSVVDDLREILKNVH